MEENSEEKKEETKTYRWFKRLIYLLTIPSFGLTLYGIASSENFTPKNTNSYNLFIAWTACSFATIGGAFCGLNILTSLSTHMGAFLPFILSLIPIPIALYSMNKIDLMHPYSILPLLISLGIVAGFLLTINNPAFPPWFRSVLFRWSFVAFASIMMLYLLFLNRQSQIGKIQKEVEDFQNKVETYKETVEKKQIALKAINEDLRNPYL